MDKSLCFLMDKSLCLHFLTCEMGIIAAILHKVVFRTRLLVSKSGHMLGTEGCPVTADSFADLRSRHVTRGCSVYILSHFSS